MQSEHSSTAKSPPATGQLPLLAVTQGDPAGIGPEVIVKALADPAIYRHAQPVVIGTAACLERAMQQTGIRHELARVDTLDDVRQQPGLLQVMEPAGLDAGPYPVGEVSAACGHASVSYFEHAIALCLAEKLAGIVTCPINKEAVQAAGYQGDLGHQEILARTTGAKLTATMLMTDKLKVAHLSTHLSLADAVANVSRPTLVDKLQLTVASLTRWGMQRPKVAVAALNPHGGEGGLLGREEIDEIAPAVADCQQLGLDVVGPYPADSIFYRALAGEFDAVLALYHDQGHIAIKVQDFAGSITATMGIPFVRTSVDHGTAFDIAGQNRADANGLKRAIEAAAKMLSGQLS